MYHPPYWSDVYPQGTSTGDEEYLFFVSLSRHRSEWMSVDQLVRATELDKERVEEIIDKYSDKGMIFQNEDYLDRWAYWERVPELVNQPEETLWEKDQRERIDQVLWEDLDE